MWVLVSWWFCQKPPRGSARRADEPQAGALVGAGGVAYGGVGGEHQQGHDQEAPQPRGSGVEPRLGGVEHRAGGENLPEVDGVAALVPQRDNARHGQPRPPEQQGERAEPRQTEHKEKDVGRKLVPLHGHGGSRGYGQSRRRHADGRRNPHRAPADGAVEEVACDEEEVVDEEFLYLILKVGKPHKRQGAHHSGVGRQPQPPGAAAEKPRLERKGAENDEVDGDEPRVAVERNVDAAARQQHIDNGGGGDVADVYSVGPHNVGHKQNPQEERRQEQIERQQHAPRPPGHKPAKRRQGLAAPQRLRRPGHEEYQRHLEQQD